MDQIRSRHPKICAIMEGNTICGGRGVVSSVLFENLLNGYSMRGATSEFSWAHQALLMQTEWQNCLPTLDHSGDGVPRISRNLMNDDCKYWDDQMYVDRYTNDYESKTWLERNEEAASSSTSSKRRKTTDERPDPPKDGSASSGSHENTEKPEWTKDWIPPAAEDARLSDANNSPLEIVDIRCGLFSTEICRPYKYSDPVGRFHRPPGLTNPAGLDHPFNNTPAALPENASLLEAHEVFLAIRDWVNGKEITDSWYVKHHDRVLYRQGESAENVEGVDLLMRLQKNRKEIIDTLMAKECRWLGTQLYYGQSKHLELHVKSHWDPFSTLQKILAGRPIARECWITLMYYPMSFIKAKLDVVAAGYSVIFGQMMIAAHNRLGVYLEMILAPPETVRKIPIDSSDYTEAWVGGRHVKFPEDETVFERWRLEFVDFLQNAHLPLDESEWKSCYDKYLFGPFGISQTDAVNLGIAGLIRSVNTPAVPLAPLPPPFVLSPSNFTAGADDINAPCQYCGTQAHRRSECAQYAANTVKDAIRKCHRESIPEPQTDQNIVSFHEIMTTLTEMKLPNQPSMSAGCNCIDVPDHDDPDNLYVRPINECPLPPRDSNLGVALMRATGANGRPTEQVVVVPRPEPDDTPPRSITAEPLENAEWKYSADNYGPTPDGYYCVDKTTGKVIAGTSKRFLDRKIQGGRTAHYLHIEGNRSEAKKRRASAKMIEESPDCELNDNWSRSAQKHVGRDGEKYGRVLAEIMRRYNDCRAGSLQRAPSNGAFGPTHPSWRSVAYDIIDVLPYQDDPNINGLNRGAYSERF